MTWKDNIRSAKFRGVPFYMDKSTIKVGRKVRVWVPYMKDYAFIEDIGKAPFEMTIEGHIIQNTDNSFDYMENRDSLIDAFELGVSRQNFLRNFRLTSGGFKKEVSAKASPGTLIHPFYGELEVVLAEPAEISETFMEGGMCRFTATFVQFQTEEFTLKVLDTLGQINNLVQNSIDGAFDTFGDVMNVGKRYVNVVSSMITGTLNRCLQSFSIVKGAIGSTLSAANGIVNSALTFSTSILDEPCNIASTIGTGVDSLLTVTGMADDIIEVGVAGSCTGNLRGSIYSSVLNGETVPYTLARSVVNAYLNMANYNEEELVFDTTTENTEGIAQGQNSGTTQVPSDQEENSKSMTDLSTSLMLTRAIDVASRMEFSYQEQAEEVITLILENLDTLLYRMGTREYDNSLSFQSLEALRRGFIEIMDYKLTSLARETFYQIKPQGEPTLNISYDLYEDVNRCSEVFERNRPKLRHPGFATGNSFIKVLDS